MQVLQFQSMLLSMLAYDAAKRPSAAEVLQHEFLKDD
jgi:serine/threonine protein kinase